MNGLFFVQPSKQPSKQPSSVCIPIAIGMEALNV